VSGRWRGKTQVAHGVDGLQALTIAATTIRKSLDKMGNVRSDSEPYEVIFPRYVPFDYGLEFHHHLCGVLDREINTKERQLTRRRLADKRRGR
jgi:hypothetical protein